MLIAGFKGNISEEIVTALPFPNKYIIPNSIHGVDEFIKYISNTKPDKVLVLGMYSGKDQDKLRIETECTNKFRNTIDGESLKILPISYFLQSNERFKLANGIGNSWCNLVSYKLVTTFPNLSYTFLHVPRQFDISAARNEILLPQGY